MVNDEILREFLLETHENLALLDSDLVTLEQNPTEKSTLAQVFRTLHSVKGTAGFMGLAKLQTVAHCAESLLTRLRAGELRFNPAIATALLKVVDAIREILANIETAGNEGDGDYAATLAEVNRLRMDSSSTLIGDPHAILLHTTPELTESFSLPPANKILPTTTPSASEPVVVEAKSRSSSVTSGNIRVDVGLLDSLMTLVGELVLARNQILQYSIEHEDGEFIGAVQRLNLLTTDLQASVMKTRMQPIGNVLSKFPRIVRDLAIACGKKVAFEMDGQDTELDKNLIEAIRDPLTHMVRNAIDHGIESPAVRVARSKPEQGMVRILAFHESGKVIIEMSDDGAGIDVVRVREKAIQNGLVTADEIGRMSQHDIMRLIFAPGFSTADKVTQFSGRGVGMDVVRTNIEKIGGTVDIKSTPGQGTTIRTKIPLTLAIIPALIVVSGGDRYAIPQVSLLELVNLDNEQALTGVEYLHGVPVYRLRGSLLPLVFLTEQLQTGIDSEATTFLPESNPTGELNIVVVQADDRPFGLVVDAIRDTEEIVVKPLQPQLKGIGVFAGAAIMGDGRVALVLDVLGIAHRANVLSTIKGLPLGAKPSGQAIVVDDRQSILLLVTAEGSQMAIPLSTVSRLEELQVDTIERLGSILVAQYRGEILALVDVSVELAKLNGQTIPLSIVEGLLAGDDVENKTISVVVCSDNDRSVGLIVGQVLDIVSDHEPTHSLVKRHGVSYSGIVYNRVTEFIDVPELIRSATGCAFLITAEVSQ